MSNLLQTNRTARHTPSDTVNAPWPFQGLMLSANAADTSLVVVGLDGTTTTTWTNGELTADIVYPIPGVRVNDTGTAATSVTIFGA